MGVSIRRCRQHGKKGPDHVEPGELCGESRTGFNERQDNEICAPDWSLFSGDLPVGWD